MWKSFSTVIFHRPLWSEQLLAERCEGLTTLENLASTVDDDTLQKFMKLFVLLYADDTVILSETPDKLQIGLDNL